MLFDVLYEDNHLLAVAKPAGLLTQPNDTGQESLEKLAKEWIKKKYQKPGNVFLEAVHRLDKPVSGVVLFGRTSKAVQRLNASMRDRNTIKLYFAIVEGQLAVHSGVLEHFLVHDHFYAKVVEEQYPEAKRARLQYKVVEQHPQYTLIQIDLETGRYHQIRVQFSHEGHPIVGDRKYGSSLPFPSEQIALHHYCLRIPHPVTANLLTFTAPFPIHWPLKPVLYERSS